MQPLCWPNPRPTPNEARLHAALAHLRENAPVALVDVPDYNPFWAITKHADIMDIERANELWINAPRPMLQTSATDELSAANLAKGGGLRTLIHMDDPLHRDIRKVGADWFRPKAMRALKTRVDELAKIYVDKMVEKGGECDFVQEVAVNFPLYVILSLLGLPESDFGRMLKLTQEMFGGDDDEFTRGKSPQELHEVITDFFRYFTKLTAERRANPTEDLASAIANAKLDGEYLNDIDCLSYYVIVASAGHDTTSAAISGGLLALIENQDQLAG